MITSSLFRWRLRHDFALWLGARIMAAMIAALARLDVRSSIGDAEYSLAISVVVAAMSIANDHRMGIVTLYANLGVPAAARASIALSVSLVSELALGKLVAAIASA